MVGIIAQLLYERRVISFGGRPPVGEQLIHHIVDGPAFGQALPEQLREGLGGSHLPVPGIAPDLMIQIQTPPRVGHMVCDQFPGSHRIFQKNGFEKFDAAAFFPRGVGKGTAAEAEGQDGLMDDPGGYLEIIPVGDGIIGFINTIGQKTG